MKTTDLFKHNRSAKRLNESMEKVFGTKLDLQSFDLPKLEDARNKLRTQLSQIRSNSEFNENIENEAVTQAQWMLDAINSEIMERQEFIVDPNQNTSEYDTNEGFGSMEEEVAKLLKTFEQNAMEIGGYGDPDINEIIKHLENGDAESAAEVVWYAYSDQDGGEFPEKEALIDDLQAEFEQLAQGGDEDEGGETDDSYALASAGHGSDEDYGFGYNESAPPTAKGERMVKHIKKGYANSGKLTDREKGIAYATAWKQHNKEKNESVNTGDNMTKLQEGEIQQAQSIVTAKTMVDRVGRWIEELSGMENDTLLQLGDQIRDEMSQEQAKTFISACAPAIQAALQNLKDTRETLASGVRMLTGEEQGAEMLGGEPDMGGDEFSAEPDAMNGGDELDSLMGDEGAPEDEFGAADAAAGGLETAGREQRESIDRSNSFLKILAG